MSEKLCPFRRKTFALAVVNIPNTNEQKIVEKSFSDATFLEEEFLPCLKEKCIKYNQVIGCGA